MDRGPTAEERWAPVTDSASSPTGPAGERPVEPTRWWPHSAGRGLVLVAVLALVAASGWWLVSRPRGVAVTVRHSTAVPVPSPAPTTSMSTDGFGGSPTPTPTPSAVPTARVVIDVEGRVRRPGVVRLSAGSRVFDALRAAGGVRPGTSTRRLNLARVLVDGEQLWVGPNPPVQAGAPAASSGGSGTAAGPVNLNTATLDQLDTLPGIGPVLAQRIIDWRVANGGFASVDQLRDVSGIGDATFADLQSLVTV